MMLASLTAAAMAASPYRPLPGAAPTVALPSCAREGKLEHSSDAEGVANLPFAMGRKFTSLDAYLTHLRCVAGPIDKPWWREVRPGVYEHVLTGTNAKPEIATRAELAERFGFSE